MDKTAYYIEGENVDGEFIAFWYETDGGVDEVTLECERTLTFAGGGHLDVYSSDTCDDFLFDVEV